MSELREKPIQIDPQTGDKVQDATNSTPAEGTDSQEEATNDDAAALIAALEELGKQR